MLGRRSDQGCNHRVVDAADDADVAENGLVIPAGHPCSREASRAEPGGGVFWPPGRVAVGLVHCTEGFNATVEVLVMSALNVHTLECGVPSLLRCEGTAFGPRDGR